MLPKKLRGATAPSKPPEPNREAGDLLAIEALDRTGLVITREGALVRIIEVSPPNPFVLSQAERQNVAARTELISAERIAGHLRVVQASFAEVITGYARRRAADLPYPDLSAEVAGAVIAAALVCAVEGWGRNGCADDLGERTVVALDLVRSGLAAFQ